MLDSRRCQLTVIMSHKSLPRSFFERPTLRVAKDLLGKYVVRRTARQTLAVRIVDVEAYIGPKDRACHASRGRTQRTEVMFGPSGITYVYLIYGMHHCLNLVTERVDYPAAVLIRGVEIIESENQNFDSIIRIDGPGRVCRFLNIDRTLNGVDTTRGQLIWVEDRGETVRSKQIQPRPRIGINYAGEWAKKPWRFCLLEGSSNRGMRRTNSEGRGEETTTIFILKKPFRMG